MDGTDSTINGSAASANPGMDALRHDKGIFLDRHLV